MEQLIRDRGTVKAKLTRVGKFLGDMNAGGGVVPDLIILQGQLDRLNKCYEEFESVHTEIIRQCEEDQIAVHEKECDEFTERYDLSRQQLLKEIQAYPSISSNILDASGQSTSSHATQSVNNPAKTNMKLPVLQPPTFYGDITMWMSFKDLFESGIDKRTDISDSQKLTYLKTSLKGEAAHLLQSLTVTNENYQQAWDILNKRYRNKRELVRTTLAKFFNQPSLSTESAEGLRKLLDTSTECLRALNTLELPVEHWDALIIYVVNGKLDSETRKQWELSQKGNELSTWNEMSDFMDLRSRALAASETTKKKQTYEKRENIPTASGLFAGKWEQEKKECVFCGRTNHYSLGCFSAQKMPLEEKRNILKAKRLCMTCLKPNHTFKNCNANVSCQSCKGKHYTIMCWNKKPESKSEEKKEESKVEKKEPGTAESLSALNSNLCTNEVLLQTLMVRIINSKNNKQKVVRALFDSGSQKSFISKKLAQFMDYPCIGEETMSHGLFGGGDSAVYCHRKYETILENLKTGFKCCIRFLDQEKICVGVQKYPDGPWMNELKKLKIEVPDSGKITEIDLLFGADVVSKLMTQKKHDLMSGPTAIETLLGWTLMGKIPEVSATMSNGNILTSLMLKNCERKMCEVPKCDTKSHSISKLWELDVLGITDPVETKNKTELQQEAREYFEKTVVLDDEQRYEVHLPWISGHLPLASNRVPAERRLKNETEKLNKKGTFNNYQKILEDWEQEGIIEEIEDDGKEKEVYYLPHRGVVKEGSTTKLRPVFDASAKEKNSPSLNDCLEKGPNLLELIPNIMVRFRLHRIGFVADIEKAFLQISVTPKHRDFLRFLWWKPDNKFKIYRHKRVVFGVNSSPFLLGAVINLRLSRSTPLLTETAQKLKKSFYVDNCVASLPSREDVEKFKNEAVQLMSEAKFNLRGWEWNGGRNLEEISVLGMMWNLHDDTIRCDMKEFNPDDYLPATKRNILSVAHRVFDQIGFACPITLEPKKMIQLTCRLKLGWDDECPVEIADSFKKWIYELQSLKNVKIPRWIFKEEMNRENWSLLVFTDASKDAYAGCVFLRGEFRGRVSVQLLLAKARVKPLEKKITIPRMELLGCCIGTRLADSAKKIIEYEDIKSYYFTDSSNAYYWIRNDDQWNPFIANRVKEIRSLSDSNSWSHIPGILNPADLPSRGCSVKELIEKKWWEGKDWMMKTQDEWPKSEFKFDMKEIDAERRKTIVTQGLTKRINPILERILKGKYNYDSIVNIIAYVQRFLQNYFKRKRGLRQKNNKCIPITVDERKDAEKVIVKWIQNDSLRKDDKELKKHNIYKDEEGIFRLKTKLFARKDDLNFRCPFVVPGEHPVVRLMIRGLHFKLSHAGNQILHFSLRQNFWIMRSRKSMKEILRDCKVCKRFTAKPFNPVETYLPPDRVEDSAAFEVTGVDLAVPLYLKNKKKCWVVLYTCAVYRAVHLELVYSLSTEEFFDSFRRFVARRGTPAVIYSDNGTNFVGAENIFKKLDWEKIERKYGIKKIQWKFNPPYAAWWGGWWERLIRMVKDLLRRILGAACVTGAELNTLLCDVEAVLNARPLTYVTEDSEDLMPLTPDMFIKDLKKTGALDCVELREKDYGTKELRERFEYKKKLREELISRFRKEYLSQLVNRMSGNTSKDSIKIGDVVLVEEKDRKRLDWPMGKVLEVFPGKDGVVRKVRLKSKDGEMTRPVQRLIPWEIPTKEEEEKTKEMVTRSGRKVKVPDRLGY